MMTFSGSLVNASPFDVHLESDQEVKKIGAEVTCNDHHEEKSPTDLIAFKVRWDPTFETTGDKYARLDFIIWQDKAGREKQLLVRYQKSGDDTITADISLQRRDLDRAIFLFRGSRSFEYFLPLSLVLDDYPHSKDAGGFWEFESLQDEEEGTEKTPVAVPKAKENASQKPDPVSKVRSR